MKSRDRLPVRSKPALLEVSTQDCKHAAAANKLNARIIGFAILYLKFYTNGHRRLRSSVKLAKRAGGGSRFLRRTATRIIIIKLMKIRNRIPNLTESKMAYKEKKL